MISKSQPKPARIDISDISVEEARAIGMSYEGGVQLRLVDNGQDEQGAFKNLKQFLGRNHLGPPTVTIYEQTPLPDLSLIGLKILYCTPAPDTPAPMPLEEFRMGIKRLVRHWAEIVAEMRLQDDFKFHAEKGEVFVTDKTQHQGAPAYRAAVEVCVKGDPARRGILALRNFISACLQRQGIEHSISIVNQLTGSVLIYMPKNREVNKGFLPSQFTQRIRGLACHWAEGCSGYQFNGVKSACRSDPEPAG